MDTLRQLYPECRSVPFTGAYLAHDLRSRSASSERPFFYANFVVSLDGRIAIPDEDSKGLAVPKAIANDRDWQLFQELAAQADLIITTGRYLRDRAQGRGQEILQVDDPRYAYLRTWRAEQGLKPHPDLAIISNSLRFPIPDVLTAGGRRVLIFTGADPDPERVKELEAQAGQVIVAGGERVEGQVLAQRLKDQGYRTIYSSAGPKILHMLLDGGVLDRLYLTFASRLLAGDPFAAVVDGPRFPKAIDARLHTLYLDTEGLEGLGQLFACYEIL